MAKELPQIFMKTRIHKQVVTDQGTSFMSVVLRPMWHFLGVQPLRTSVYHPQTNRFVERFNGTLKCMLRKLVGDSRKDWPQWLPFLQFAIREVPQASTGFSLFKLLYRLVVCKCISL